ncbi:hypothetical protein BGW42_006734 [Actinomortierella wolfii]|nr:hypothetical protein BGW42_006734 [Actinomortierella wolfii]
MICSYLVHCGATAEEAIRWYGEKRTLDGCGVTIPSQLRYIRYYEEFLEARTLHYDPRLLVLHEILIDTIPKPLQRLDPGSNYVILTIFSGDTKIYESLPHNSHVDTKNQQIRVYFPDKIVLAGDVKIMLWYDSPYKRDNLLSLTKAETDKACKDKLHAIFDPEFKIHTRFAPAFAHQSPLHTLPEEATQSILLRYRNHLGPNNVQVRPPSFSTMRLTQRSRNSPWLKIFTQGDESDTKEFKKTEGTSADTGSSSSMAISNHPPVLQTKSRPTLVQQNGSVFAPKPSVSIFRPSRADKDRDRDDDWDTASVSSDCSESDTATEWWYTKPPQMRYADHQGKSKSPLSSPPNSRGRTSLDNPMGAYGHTPTSPLATGRTIEDAADSRSSMQPSSAAATSAPKDGPSMHPPASSVLQRNEHAPLLSVSRGNLSGAIGVNKSPSNTLNGNGLTGTSTLSAPMQSSPPSSALHHQSSLSPLVKEIAYGLKIAREGLFTQSEERDDIQQASSMTTIATSTHAAEQSLEPNNGHEKSNAANNHYAATSLLSPSFIAGNGSDSSVYSEQTNVSIPSTVRSETESGTGWVDTMSRWLWPSMLSVPSTSVSEQDVVDGHR